MSMRKTVEGATKPKRAAPKAKYIDPIVQATFSQDGQLQEVIRTLAQRMRDPNTTVVFKSLLVLHTLMRSGSIDSVFPYLSSSSISLSLSSHEAPNLSAYGHYLAARIKAYANLKRDAIRDKSDRRNANRMRKLSVEQGLLRETREIQRMIAALVESKFYTEEVDDDVSMTALRLLVKDLLVLFTIVNEGIINILENFFALSKPDCETALKIYKTFCRDTEKVVAYLGTAKKLYNVLNIPIPNLKHAPLSLAKSLEEYLQDPNFEQNRQEYKENKRIADGGAPRATPPTASTPSSSSAVPASSAPSTSAAPASSQPAPKTFTDFFESIETAQTPMFAQSPPPGPQMGFFPLQQQQTGFNPFLGAQPTGLMPPFAQQGMMMPQMTGANPFLLQQQQQATGFSPMMQPQMTGFGAQLAPQMTGMGGMAPNPFRQSMMQTGGGAPNPFGAQQTGSPFPQQQGSMPPPVPQLQPQATGAPSSPFGAFGAFGAQGQGQQVQPQATGNPFGAQRQMSMAPQPTGNPFGQQQQQAQQVSSPFPGANASAAPGAPPLGAPTSPAPLVAQKTGARNPFAPAPGTVIPQSVPPPAKQPSMYELAAQRVQAQATGAPAQQQQPQQGQQEAPKDAFSLFLAQQQAKREAEEAAANGQAQAPLIAQKTGGLMASIATDLARSGSPAASPSGASSPFGSSFAPSASLPPFSSTGTSTLSTPFSSLSLNTSSALSPSLTGAPTTASPLSAQPTGFAGSNVRPFQPSSSFGSKLASELSAQPTGFAAGGGGGLGVSGSGNASPAPQSQPQSPLQQQPTGYNPFGGTRLPPLNSPLSAGLTAQPTGAGAGSGFGAGGAGAGATGSLI
ncbi:hypothetical protein JCM10450v2_004762 [Rhodotorula kratochvilovae]